MKCIKVPSFPLVITEVDASGNLLTWDTSPHFRDRQWIEFQWLGYDQAMSSPDPDHCNIRALRFLKGDEIWTPSDALENRYFWISHLGVQRVPGCVMALVETDYPDLYRSPRIYSKETHWGICLLMEEEEKRYLKIPQSEAELHLAYITRIICHCGMFGATPGLKEDICVEEDSILEDPASKGLVMEIIKTRRREAAYNTEVTKKMKPFLRMKVKEMDKKADLLRAMFDKRLKESKVGDFSLDKEGIFRCSDEIIRRQIMGYPAPKCWLDLRDGYPIPDFIWEANNQPLVSSKISSGVQPSD